MYALATPIAYLKGVGPKRAEVLEKDLNIRTFEDLLHYYPFRYVDKSQFYKVSEVHSDLPYIQLVGNIIRMEEVGAKRSNRLVAYVQDETGLLELVWFKGVKWVKNSIKTNTQYVVFGKPNLFNGKINIAHPEIESVEEYKKGIYNKLQPMYPSSEKLSSKGLNNKAIGKLTQALLPKLKNQIRETLSADLLQKLNLQSREDALFNIHFPKNIQDLQRAQYRLKFEELFFIQLQLIQMKQVRQQKLKGHNFSNIGQHFNQFFNEYLPFELTNAQKRVLKEIRRDCGGQHQMNRLLQGDVGSGKTLVALMSVLMAIDNGFQACLMAPTEILANQHFETISDLVKNLPIKVGLLTGSKKAAERKVLHQEL